MGFSDKQIHMLRRRPNDVFIRSRQAHGRELSYIEGWYAIAEANRIFGFDGWDRKTVETKCVLARESRGGNHVVYVAKVRVVVRAEGMIVIREGFGTGEAQSQSTGEAHEKALKTAETDATKRALATFGNPFGLSLYNSARKNRVGRSPPGSSDQAPIPDHMRRRTLQQRGPNGRYYVPARPAINFALAAAKCETMPAHPVPIQNSDDSHAANEGQNQAPGAESGSDALQPLPAIPAPSSQSEPGRLLIDWPKRHRDPAHLKFVGSQPCLICGRAPSDAHHLRFAQVRALGRKVSDEFTVPLCRTHHRQLHHAGNESNWWIAMDGDIDPLEIAKGLWEQSQSRRSSTEISVDRSDLYSK